MLTVDRQNNSSLNEIAHTYSESADANNFASNSVAEEAVPSPYFPDASTIARMFGVTIGVLVLAASSDPFGALIICLTFWLAGLIMQWPVKVLGLKRYFPLYGFKSVWDMHLWIMALLLMIMILCQQETVFSIQFWLLLTAVGYHLTRVKFHFKKSTL